MHGFASGPQSRKAVAFRAALDSCGFDLEVPRLDGGDFEHLSLSRQLKLLESLLGGERCCLVGSSMGGYLAALYASRHPDSVDRSVLLAPAFDFATRWREMRGPEEVARWKESGWLEVYHYGDKTTRKVHYDLLADAGTLPGFPDSRQPTLIFHGVNDSVVPIDLSRRFISGQPKAHLREVDSDHELLDVLNAAIAESVPWLMGPTPQISLAMPDLPYSK